MKHDIEVVVVRHEYDRSIEIGIKVPFDVYAGALYPNEVLREAVAAAFDEFLSQRR